MIGNAETAVVTFVKLQPKIAIVFQPMGYKESSCDGLDVNPWHCVSRFVRRQIRVSRVDLCI